MKEVLSDEESGADYILSSFFLIVSSLLVNIVMVLGDQYKPDKGGGTEIKNVFFENNIFYRNHWPKDVLIQPKS